MTIKFLLPFCLIVFLFACNKNEKQPVLPDPVVCLRSDTPPDRQGTIECKVDGVSWKASKKLMFIQSESGLTQIFAEAEDGSSLYFFIKADSEGSYPLDSSHTHYARFTRGDGKMSFDNVQPVNTVSNLVISKKDLAAGTISGTFQFSGLDFTDNRQVSITEGSFTDIKLEDVSTFPIEKFFLCSVDNVCFEPNNVGGDLDATANRISIGGSTCYPQPSVCVPSIFFNLPYSIKPGTYSLGDANSSYSAEYALDQFTKAVSESGELVILSHNVLTKRIIGTFNFNAIQPGSNIKYEIKNGSFSATY